MLRQSRQDQSVLPGRQPEGGDGRLEPAYSRPAQAGALQLGIQELRRQLSLAVGNLEGQGLLEGKAPCFQRHALGKWNQPQVLRRAGAVLCRRSDRRHQQGSSRSPEMRAYDHELSPERKPGEVVSQPAITNNRMELQSAISVLTTVKETFDIMLFTDSSVRSGHYRILRCNVQQKRPD